MARTPIFREESLRVLCECTRMDFVACEFRRLGSRDCHPHYEAGRQGNAFVSGRSDAEPATGDGSPGAAERPTHHTTTRTLYTAGGASFTSMSSTQKAWLSSRIISGRGIPCAPCFMTRTSPARAPAHLTSRTAGPPVNNAQWPSSLCSRLPFTHSGFASHAAAGAPLAQVK